MLLVLKKCFVLLLIVLFCKPTNICMRTVISGPSGYKSAVDKTEKSVKGFKLSPSSVKPNNKSVIDVDWEYWGPNGEYHWEKNFKSCKGKSQSPINIIRERIVYLPDLQMTLINYDRDYHNMKLTNNGHTIKLEASHLTGKRFQSFTTGSAFFGDTYRFLQLHFHWRNAHSGGSEHAIDGEKFSMEMHLVHQNVKYDKETDSEIVLKSPDAFAVIAVFFNETTIHNLAIDPIIGHLDQVANPHESTILDEPIRLDSLMPPTEELNRFYRYSGSYTTPGCQEVVTWIIFPTALVIDAIQMQKFREIIFRVTHHGNESNTQTSVGKKARMLSHFNEQFIGFYRHIQEIGNRRIYAPESMIPDSAPFVALANNLIIVVCCILAIFM